MSKELRYSRRGGAHCSNVISALGHHPPQRRDERGRLSVWQRMRSGPLSIAMLWCEPPRLFGANTTVWDGVLGHPGERPFLPPA